MRPKGIKPIELYADKIFLGVFALIFLLVLALQFVGQGNVVQVGARDDVPVDRAYRLVAEEAARRQAQMNDNEVDDRVPANPPEITSQLAAAVTARERSARSVALGPPSAPLEGVGRPLEGDANRYALPTPPPAARPVAKAFGATVDPYEARDVPELRRFLPDQQPYDMFAVSVQTTFDVERYREILREDPDGPGELDPIPTQWWQNRLEVLDVQLFRRTIDEHGAPGPAELLPPPPGVFSLRDQIDRIESAGQLNALVTQARSRARDIRSPFFYNIISGERWSPPISSDESAGPDPRFVELQSLRRDLEERRRRLDQARPEAREQIEAEIQRLENRRRELEQGLTAAGIDPATGRRQGPDPALVNDPDRLRDVNLAAIWTHDVRVTPGATYQYRVRLVLPNPLMGYEQIIAEDLWELARLPVLRTLDSEWSEPVRVSTPSVVFVDSARPAATGVIGATRPNASIELYQFFYGYWRKGSSRVEPGDALAAEIPLPQAYPIFELPDSETRGGHQIVDETGSSIFAFTGHHLLDVLSEPMLDTAAMAGRERTRYAALLGDESGRVWVRRPELDRRDALRERLERSVEQGLTATVRTPRPTRAPAAVSGPAADHPAGGQPRDEGDRSRPGRGLGDG